MSHGYGESTLQFSKDYGEIASDNGRHRANVMYQRLLEYGPLKLQIMGTAWPPSEALGGLFAPQE